MRCDKFTVEFYPSGKPKSFQSDLTFIKDNQAGHSINLRVNHPVAFQGFRFYQASYGAAADRKATLALLRDGDHRDVINVAQGFVFDLPGNEGTFQVLRVDDNLMNMGPAIKIAVRSNNNEENAFWVFQQIDKIKKINPDIFEEIPVFNPGSFRPYTFSLLGLEDKYYTGLQVNHNPGTPVVAVAAVILICGLLLILFSYARSVWIRVEQGKDKVCICVTGRSYRNQAGLQKEVQYLVEELKANLENSK